MTLDEVIAKAQAAGYSAADIDAIRQEFTQPAIPSQQSIESGHALPASETPMQSWSPDRLQATLDEVAKRGQAAGWSGEDIRSAQDEVIVHAGYGDRQGKAVSAEAYEQTTMDQIGEGIKDAGDAVGADGGRLAQFAVGTEGLEGQNRNFAVADLLPGVGNAASQHDAEAAQARGDWIGATLSTIGAGIPAGRVARLMAQGPTGGNRLSNLAARVSRGEPNAPPIEIQKSLDPNDVPGATTGAYPGEGYGSRAAATSAKLTAGLPLVGQPQQSAARRTADALTEHGTAARHSVGPDVGDHTAGEQIKRGAHTWTRTTDRTAVRNAYDAADAHLPLGPGLSYGQLPRTTAVGNSLWNADDAAGAGINSPVIKKILEKASDPDGISVSGAKHLLQALKTEANALEIATAGTHKPAAKRVVTALTHDLNDIIREHGGQDAVNALVAAKQRARQGINWRKSIEKIVGKTPGEDAGEGISGEHVIKRLGEMAKNDFQALTRLRNVIGSDSDEWRAARRALMERQGYKNTGTADEGGGTFDLNKWANNYLAMPQNSRRLIYGQRSSHLDDLARLSQRFTQARRGLGNPSQSGNLAVTSAGFASVGTAYATDNPAAIVLAGIGAGQQFGFSYVMSRPRVVRAMNRLITTIADPTTASMAGGQVTTIAARGLASALRDEGIDDSAFVEFAGRNGENLLRAAVQGPHGFMALGQSLAKRGLEALPQGDLE